MFYKVTIIEKNDNHREMIVKADSKEAAMEMMPAAKGFLFPGEDTSEYFAYPDKIHLDVMDTKVPYWRIVVTRPCESQEAFPDEDWGMEVDVRNFTMTVKAESPEEAIRMAREDVDYPSEAYAEEVSVATLIGEEEKYLRYRIKEEYILAKHGDVSVREYNRLMRKHFSDELNEFYYEAVQFFLGKVRLRNALSRSIDLSKIPVTEYEELISRWMLIKEREGCEALLNEAKAKYGKEVKE